MNEEEMTFTVCIILWSVFLGNCSTGNSKERTNLCIVVCFRIHYLPQGMNESTYSHGPYKNNTPSTNMVKAMPCELMQNYVFQDRKFMT